MRTHGGRAWRRVEREGVETARIPWRKEWFIAACGEGSDSCSGPACTHSNLVSEGKKNPTRVWNMYVNGRKVDTEWICLRCKGWITTNKAGQTTWKSSLSADPVKQRMRQSGCVIGTFFSFIPTFASPVTSYLQLNNLCTLLRTQSNHKSKTIALDYAPSMC